jgi:uncharacterized protein (TIGR02246 family)
LGQAGTSDEQAVQDVLKNLAAAQNAKDAQTVASLFTEDGDFVTSRGQRAAGRQSIENLCATYHKSDAYKNGVVKYGLPSVRVLSPGCAIADYNWEWAGVRAPDSKEPRTRKGAATAVLIKKDGKWSIVALRAMVPAKD